MTDEARFLINNSTLEDGGTYKVQGTVSKGSCYKETELSFSLFVVGK